MMVFPASPFRDGDQVDLLVEPRQENDEHDDHRQEGTSSPIYADRPSV